VLRPTLAVTVPAAKRTSQSMAVRAAMLTISDSSLTGRMVLDQETDRELHSMPHLVAPKTRFFMTRTLGMETTSSLRSVIISTVILLPSTRMV
jgi:hypothetical protein